LALFADHFQAYNTLGNVYQSSGQLDAAMSCYRKALAINPDYAEALTNLGNALQESGRLEPAIECYERALELRPTFAEAAFNLGNAFKTLRRHDAAIPRFQAAIDLKPSFTEAHVALGRSLYEVGERERAIESFRKACSLQPENPEARWGLVLTEVALVHEDPGAVESYRESFARGLVELDAWFNADRLGNGFAAVGTQQPFYLAYQEENNRDLLSRYGALCRRLAEPWQNEHGLTPRPRRPGKRVRVGLVSAHICNHSVWHAIIKGWCRDLDTERFQLDIFSLGKMIDNETEFAESRATRFVRGLVRPQQWAEAILAEPLDALIYPEVGMDSMAVKLASLRLAPVQATTWGHPETSGLPTMDYYISATAFEPRDAQQNYSETLITLPNLGCDYEPLGVAEETLSLETIGVNPDVPLFICPGTPFKYAPRHDGVFTQIARRLGKCQFVFFRYPLESLSGRLMKRLEASFKIAGLRFEDYVIEIPWLLKPQFASLMRQADAFLDTIGFSGFNTAMQAVESGLPIVAKDGRFLRGRLASGILRRLGADELIAASDEEYAALAVRMIEDRDFHTRMRENIERSRHLLFDDVTSVRALEDFLAESQNH
jgi:predicted O-linked N-acetylglucosamine transferase (SPINDLY family)